MTTFPIHCLRRGILLAVFISASASAMDAAAIEPCAPRSLIFPARLSAATKMPRRAAPPAKRDHSDAIEAPEDSVPLNMARNRGAAIQSIIRDISIRQKIHPALIKAIIMAESGFQVKAVSESGARGLMQLMPQTASALGVTDAFNPKENIEAGVKYFKKLVDMFKGDLKLALAAYNAGNPVSNLGGIINKKINYLLFNFQSLFGSKLCGSPQYSPHKTLFFLFVYLDCFDLLEIGRRFLRGRVGSQL